MATNLVTITEYNQGDALVAGEKEVIQVVIAAGEGTILRGQVIAYDTTVGKWKKYVSGGANGTGVARAIVDTVTADATADVKVSAIYEGEVKSTGIIGINYIASTDEIATPSAPTLTVQAGGTLAATTQHDYVLVGTNDTGGKTTTSGSTSATTLAVAAGYVQGLQVANIAAVNAVLGDCSVTPKTVIFTVDGVTHSATFNLDYSGAGALANHAALVTALDGAGYTPTSSDGAKIKIASDTTGASSSVTILSDTTGLFATPTTVAGVAVSRTIKVAGVLPSGATGLRAYRTVGGVVAYRDFTSAELLAGYMTDTGSLTWTVADPVTASDYTAIINLFDNKIIIVDLEEGYNFRGGY